MYYIGVMLLMYTCVSSQQLTSCLHHTPYTVKRALSLNCKTHNTNILKEHPQWFK